MQQTDCQSKVNSLQDYHEALQRNGYCVPALNQPICTLAFMQEIRQHITFTPRYQDLVIRPCPRPPTKQTLTVALIQVIEGGLPNLAEQQRPPYAQLLKHLRARSADKEYLLRVLSTLTRGEHMFFDKAYLPPPRQKRQILINNDDNFFSGLPQSRSKAKRDNLRVLLSEEQRALLKLAQAQEAAKASQERLDRQMTFVNDLKRQQRYPDECPERQVPMQSDELAGSSDQRDNTEASMVDRPNEIRNNDLSDMD